MSDAPTLVKVLRYLRDNTAPSTYNDIISTVQEGQVLIDRALNKLLTEGIVERRDQYYCYTATPRAEELCQKLFALYEKMAKSSQLELLARGLLCQSGKYYVLRVNTFLQVLGKEGFTQEDMTHFLNGEVERGYVKRVRGFFVAKVSASARLFMPSYYPVRQVSADEYRQLKERASDSGLLCSEEDYFIGAYPAELAEPTIRYMETRKQELKQVLEREPLREWCEPDDHIRPQ